jgi:hypothetical protein
VGERCLLGWMPRADAVKHLIEECIEPHFDAQSAAEAWQDYHQRVQELPERNAPAPDRLPLTSEEETQRRAFLRNNHGAPNIRDVIKIDPGRCVVLQLQVITERAEMYAAAATSSREKTQHCLGTNQQQVHQLNVAAAFNAVRVTVPHAEFGFNLVLPNMLMQIQQLARHISVCAFDARMLLFGGYHRSFALSSLHNPEAIERSLVAVLTTDGDALLSPDSPNQTVRDMVRCTRPPLFGDFFDDRLAMNLRVRKRRPELWIQGQIKWFDDPS